MAGSNLRIVSLIPSGTEILAALGLTDAIVGRSHECDYPPEIKALPVCTKAKIDSDGSTAAEIHNQIDKLLKSALSVYAIKTDVLEQLQPTHIITQDQCEVCAVSLAEVEQAVSTLTHTQAQIISLHPNLLNDVWNDIERIGDALGVHSEQLLKNLLARVKVCEQKIQALVKTERPTVACIEWSDPLMIAGNWIPEMVSLVGGQPLVGAAGQPSLKLQFSSLVASDPDIIILMPCGFDLNRTRQEAKLLSQNPQWQNLKAVRTGRVYIVDGNSYFNRPGPRLVDSLEILGEIIQPEMFQYGYEGSGWERLTPHTQASEHLVSI